MNPRSLLTQLALGSATLALTGCASFAGTSRLGTFSSSGGLLGAWATTANYCSSGVSKDRFGTTTIVSFAHKAGRFHPFELTTGAVSGKPGMVLLETGDPFRQLQLDAARCARFDVQQRIQPDGTLGADVELDCDTGDGNRVTASIHAASCR